MRTILNNLYACVFVVFFFLQCTFLFAADYYVNDNNTTGDVFCSNVGLAGNNGTSAVTPKSTLTEIWNTYGPSGSNVLSSGDNIYIDAGEYNSDINLQISVDGLSFIGAGIDVTIFDNNYAGSATNYFMYITGNNTYLRNMTIREYENNGTQTPGHSGQAITVKNASGVELDGISFFQNGQSGGNPSISVLSNSEVWLHSGGSFCNTDGTAYTGGVEAYGTNIDLLIENYIIAHNYKTGYSGGGIRIEGNNTTVVTVKNTSIFENTATDGGGVAVYNGNLHMYDCIIDNNSAGQTSTTVYGGGVYISSGNATFSRCIFSNNSEASGTLRGGGIAGKYLSTGAFSSYKGITIALDSCLFDNNSPVSTGTDIYGKVSFSVPVNITLTDCQFINSPATNIVSATATSISGTFQGSAPSVSGSNISGSASTNQLYTANPTVPEFIGDCGLITLLPIEVTSFSSICTEGVRTIKWETATEIDNEHFMVEKSLDGINYEDYKRASRLGNSMTRNTYEINDESELPGTIYYRLKQTDIDGNELIAGTISSKGCFEIDEQFTVLFNSSNSDLNIYYDTSLGGNYQVSLINLYGQAIKRENLFIEPGSGIHNIHILNPVPEGLYVVSISNTSGILQTEKCFISMN
jgi:hypothetical protein